MRCAFISSREKKNKCLKYLLTSYWKTTQQQRVTESKHSVLK